MKKYVLTIGPNSTLRGPLPLNTNQQTKQSNMELHVKYIYAFVYVIAIILSKG